MDAEVSGGGTAVGGWGPVRSHGPFRVLFRSRTVSAPGESVTLVALMLSVAESTGQALAVAALLLVGDFVPALPAPLTGVAADRSGPRRVMVGCGAVRAAAPATAALWLPPLLTLVSVHPAAGQVFLASSRAAVPGLVRGPALASANAAVGFDAHGAEALGPLLAAALFPLVGIRGALAVAALCFLCSAVWLPPLPAGGGQRAFRPWAGARDGPGVLRRAPGTGGGAGVRRGGRLQRNRRRGATLPTAEPLGADGSAVGLLLGTVGIGLAAGDAWPPRSGRSVAPVVLLLAGFVVSSPAPC